MNVHLAYLPLHVCPPPEREYMLMYDAIRHGDMDSLLTALAHGLDTDCRDKYNKTPLMVACAHGRTDMAHFLIDRGYATCN